MRLSKIIAKEFRASGVPEADQFTDEALEQGKLLILLDGLDEAPVSKLDRALVQIRNFVNRYSKNRFVASCRSAAYYSSLLNFTEVEIAAFDDVQIEQFMRNWFHSDLDQKAKTDQKCWEVLHSSKNAGTKELAHNPLFLTLLCFCL